MIEFWLHSMETDVDLSSSVPQSTTKQPIAWSQSSHHTTENLNPTMTYLFAKNYYCPRKIRRFYSSSTLAGISLFFIFALSIRTLTFDDTTFVNDLSLINLDTSASSSNCQRSVKFVTLHYPPSPKFHPDQRCPKNSPLLGKYHISATLAFFSLPT